ncbi:MAG: LLM class flavin-dependent oxidoreductase [Acidimicrobiales bacterium]|nr:LLM class flavin-dependent oxidoreductase [Acidimicrobiales bacterium]
MQADPDTTAARPSLTCALVGADSLLIECGETLLAGGHRVEVVAASSPRVATWAASHGIPVVDATGPASEWAGELAGHEFQWLFAITHLAILPDEVLAVPTAGAVNFHDGPLPRYAGLNTPAWALLRGEATYGITWHLITAGVDEGDVVARRDFDIAPGETSLSLNTRNFEGALESFGELVDQLAAGTHRPEPQDPDAERHTFSRHDRPEAMAVIDWRRPATEVDRLVRALTFGPYPNPLAAPKVLLGDGRVVAVGRSEVLDDAGTPGEVLSADDGTIVVAAADGAVALSDLTSLTGRPVDGLGVAEGDRLPVPDDAARAALTEAGSAAARHERAHLAALHELEPVEVPWARAAGADHRPAHRTRPLAVPAGLDDGAVVAGAALLLGRLARKPHFHLGLVAPAAPDAVAPLLAPATPVALSIDGPTVADVVDAVTDRLGAAERRGPALADLVGRHPDLAADPRLAAGGLVPVAVRLGSTGDPTPGVVLELRRDEAGWSLVHDGALLDDADAARFASSLEAVLAVVGGDPGAAVEAVDLVDAATRSRLLDEWNDTARDVPSTTIHEQIAAQADATPDAPALVFEGSTLTYRELDERASRLAHHLRSLGVGRGDLVGVHVPRSLELVVAVVATHRAGAAYVPLDPTYPRDRVAHMITDSGCRVIVTDGPVAPPAEAPAVVDLTADAAAIAGRPATRPEADAGPDDLAYCIYTSGSTGLPKGVLVEHRNVVNFFAAMDDVVPHDPPGTWLAVTSLSFDISVLELLYTLTRGFEVVVYLDRARTGDEADGFAEAHAGRPMDFSLFYFSGDASGAPGRDRYRLLLDGARFADSHGFAAVWTPERHFHDFGGLYPNPAVTGAAVAAITENVAIRAGSVVVPLQHPIRVAEAWSVVDNLSDGRVGISVASGWQPDDFVLRPETYATAKQTMFDEAEEIRRLWRGEAVGYPRPDGTEIEVSILPRPVQAELPLWVTSAGNVDTYVAAGRIGANVLTHLLGQSVEQLAPKIEAYRTARAEAGHDPDTGIVSLMLHTFVGDDEDEVRELARQPLKDYLGTSFSLLKEYAWAFPAFSRPEGATDGGLADEDFKNLSDEDLDAVLDFAFNRYYETSGLFGTPERCRRTIDGLKAIGVDEVACLVDFGIDTDTVLASLPVLDEIRRAANRGEDAAVPAVEVDHSFAAQVERHGVTHLQFTPSMARMLSQHDESRAALATIDHLYVGGEAFPVALADDLRALAPGATITNMYGPTETTIWSTTHRLTPDDADIPIGTPIANTSVYVLDDHRRLLPPGVAGDLWIGGDGVVRGYHDRPELTAERFVPDPFRGGGRRMYTTGDLVRWREAPDGGGVLEYIGRADHQVKIRGYRIELGEIETRMGSLDGVLECVAVVREDTPGDQQLVGYVSPRPGHELTPDAVKDHLRVTLPDVMIPGHVAVLPALPHTPNGKIDRNALPSLAEVLGARGRGAAPAPAGSDLERSVLKVWSETLGLDDIGVDDNFFDIGGHSLLVVRLHRRLREVLDVTCPLTDLYRYPTVRSFAESLESGPSTEVVQRGRDRAARRRTRRRGAR